MYTQMKARPRPLFTSLPTGLLQRACACGGTPGVDGECEECRKKRLSRQPSAAHVTSSQAVPTIVHDVLHSSGHPLDARTRTFMETRFGHDFSNVRVHTDARAAESARAVNALAYTVGRDVVFGTGQYAPGTSEGRKLMAHELTHVVQQQNSNTNRVQTSLIIGDANDHREQEAEQVAKAVVYGTSVNALPEVAGLNPVLRRVVGPCPDTSTPHTLLKLKSQNPAVREAQRKLNQFHNNEKAAKKAGLKDAPLVEDCIFGEKTYNAVLSFQKLVFPKQPAEHDGIIGDHTWKELDKVGPTPLAPGPSTPPSLPTPSSGKVCGPNVTSAVVDAISKLRSTFSTSWTSDEKDSACNGFISKEPDPAKGMNPAYLNAWDIEELHHQAWINRPPYSPPCAMPNIGACENSVIISGNCFYAGSVNYVIFGVMWKLCRDHFSITGPVRFSETAMTGLIRLYKGPIPGHHPVASPNWIPSTEWAKAGFHGWSGGSTPSADRPDCTPSCGEYAGPAFKIYWYPKGDF